MLISPGSHDLVGEIDRAPGVVPVRELGSLPDADDLIPVDGNRAGAEDPSFGVDRDHPAASEQEVNAGAFQGTPPIRYEI